MCRHTLSAGEEKMKRIKYLALVLTFLLSGCTLTDQPENQAIAIALAVDHADGGEIQISVLLPSLSGTGQSADKSSGSPYTVASATAHSFAEAIGILRASIPLTLNLAQLKTVYISQHAAQDEGLIDLISDMFLTHRLYNAAFCVISIGSARDMLNALNTNNYGARLSSVVTTALENFVAEGGIPDTHFSDFYYDLHSIYGSPIAILGAASDGIHTTLTPEGRAGDSLPGAMPREGNNKNEYSGTALFRDGQMVGTLSSLETAWMNYLRGRKLNINYSCEGANVVLSPVGGAEITVDTSVEPMQIEIAAAFTVSTHCSLDILRSLIEADISSLVRKCQSLGVDPFLFSQRAAVHFHDIPAWLDYAYYTKYPSADVQVQVNVRMITD